MPDGGVEVDGFESLRRTVLADPALQRRLRAHRGWDGFCAACHSIAAERRLVLGGGELEWVRSMTRRPGQAGAHSSSAWAPEPDRRRPPGFTPVEFDPGSGLVEWVDMRGVDVGRAFYEEAVRSALTEPFRLLFRARTSVAELEAPDPDHPGAAPRLAGLIFHTSRCGSTLVCRMLAQVPGTIVISEPAIVDQLTRAPGTPEALRRRWVASAVAALSRGLPGATRAVLKLDSWASRHLGLLRSTFPETPWVFLHRRPAEVVASQARAPSMTCAPGMLPAQLFDLSLEEARRMPSEQYCAIVIATLLTDALEHLDDHGCPVGYEELPDAVVSTILPRFGITAGAGAREAMRSVAQLDAKQPVRRFNRDAAPRPTAVVRDACRRHADEPYAALRALARQDAVRGSARW